MRQGWKSPPSVASHCNRKTKPEYRKRKGENKHREVDQRLGLQQRRSSAVQGHDERWENSAPVLARVISRMKDEMMETKECGGATKRCKETASGVTAAKVSLEMEKRSIFFFQMSYIREIQRSIQFRISFKCI